MLANHGLPIDPPTTVGLDRAASFSSKFARARPLPLPYCKKFYVRSTIVVNAYGCGRY